MEKLFTLLALQRQVLEVQTRSSFAYVIVNETLRIVPYQQGIFWSINFDKITLEKASGNLIVDNHGPYAEEIKKIIHPFLTTETGKIIKLFHDGKSIALVLFKIKGDRIIGGLWLENDKEFKDSDIQILEELSVSYTHVLSFLLLKKNHDFFANIKKVFHYKKRIIVAIIFLCFLPVRQTITAPAEIVARDAQIITVPYDGMLEKITVAPGDIVKQDQVVAIMENSAISAQVTLAEQALIVAEAALARLQREALSDPDKKADLIALESEIAEKKIEYTYAIHMQKNSDIKSLRDGTAIFADAKKLQGKPVHTGELLMMVSDPNQAELLIRVPVDALVPIKVSTAVDFYLNVSPLWGREAIVENIGYQPSPDADGLLSYKIRAKILDKDNLRIGWQGTAKVRGQWTILSYSILRRPLAAFRHLTGI